MITEWFDGKDGFMRKTVEKDPDGKNHKFTLEILEKEISENLSFDEIMQDHVSHRQTKTVEVLYSGGIDSEGILNSLHTSGVPVTAITMRLMANGYPINTHDLYYSEKFCRENGITQKIIDLDVKTFYESGKFLDYIEPYTIRMPHVATHFWLFEQTTGFPVLGGCYFWPWTRDIEGVPTKIISPNRYDYTCYQIFLRDNGIHGIGDMLGWSLESNIIQIKAHNEVVKKGIYHAGTGSSFPNFKCSLQHELGFTRCEPRMKNYGYEFVDTSILDIATIRRQTTNLLGEVSSKIVWSKQIADVLGGAPGSNDRYK